MPSKVLDEITYQYPNFNGGIVELGVDMQFHPTLHNICNYLPMVGLMIVNGRNWGYASWYHSGKYLQVKMD